MEKDSLIKDLPFVVERINDKSLQVTPKYQGLSKKERDKLKQKASTVNIIVFDDEIVNRLDSITVDYPNIEPKYSIGSIVRCLFK